MIYKQCSLFDMCIKPIHISVCNCGYVGAVYFVCSVLDVN